MARPIREGIDYFPCDTEWDIDMKVFKAKFGLEGVGFMIELWKSTYANGYYYPWNNDTKLLFSADHHLTPERIEIFVNFAIEKNLISGEILNKYNVITSSGIQRRYIKICEKRTQITLINEYLLIDIESVNKPSTLTIKLHKITPAINSPETRVSGEKTQVSGEFPGRKPGFQVPETTQSKAKQSKEKEINKEQQQCNSGDLSGTQGIATDSTCSNAACSASAAALFDLKKYFKEQQAYCLEYDDDILADFEADMRMNSLNFSFLDFLIGKMQAKEKIKPINNPSGFLMKAFKYANLIQEWRELKNDPKNQPRAAPPQICDECHTENFFIRERELCGKERGQPHEIVCDTCGVILTYNQKNNTWKKQLHRAKIMSNEETLAFIANLK